MSWNIGNTTVRNPRRIREGLKIFGAEFDGNLDGTAKESMFVRRLVAEGIVETEKAETESLDWHGRKWRSCFNKLGFITGKIYRKMGNIRVTLEDLKYQQLGLSGCPYELTPAGLRLLDADTESAIGDVFLRQLLRLEITSPVEKEPDDVRIKPFILLLQILDSLEKIGAAGLNRIEIAAFVQTAKNHDRYDQRAQQIIDYRNERESKFGEVQKRKFDLATVDRERVLAKLKSKSNTLIDYADTTFRYCRMTGLLSLQGSRLKIREETRLLVNEILKNEPDFLASDNPLEYLIDFYRGSKIPTDDAPTALREIAVFESCLSGRKIEPVVKSSDLIGKPLQELALAKHRIENQFLLAIEEEFVETHSKNDAVIDDVLAYLRVLNGIRNPDIVIEDKPAYLEWSIWRALLIFNSLDIESNKTRRFSLDADLRPVGCAPGGGPDIIMDYQNFVAVAEVTMTSGSRQEAVEGEPVRRHVADVQLDRQSKEVYCLFIAPSIDDNTAETFRNGIWWTNHKPVYLNVVPLTLPQFIRIVESMKTLRRTTEDLKSILDRCLVFRNKVGPEWLQQIDNEIDDWVNKK